MNEETIFELKISVPFLKKGSKFLANDMTGEIYWYETPDKVAEYPLRSSLSGYLWLLMTEKKFVKIIKRDWL